MGGERRARVWSLLPVAALTILAAALRFPALGEQSYWLDEAITVDLLRRDFGEMLRALPGSESTPPLYYVVAWTWAKAFGTGEVGLRALSAICGTAVVPVAFASGAALRSRQVGLIAAAFAAASPLLVWYSQEARAYALYALLGALSFLLFARALRQPDDRTLLAWAAASALALATHYFAVFIVVAEAALLLVLTPRRVAVATASGAVAVTGLALLPLAVYQERGGRTSWIAGTPIGDRIEELVRQFVSGTYPLPHAQKLAALLVVLAGASVALRASPAERRAAFVPLAVGGATILLALALALAGLDYFSYRNLLVAWLPLALVLAVAFGATHLGAAVATLLVAASVGVVAATATREDLARDDWRSVRDTLAIGGQKLVVVAPAFERVPLEYYRPELRTLGAGSVAVTEIVIIGYPDEGSPFPPSDLRVSKSFRRVESRLLDRIRVIRFRAERPVAVSAVRIGLAGAGPAVLILVDRGGPGARGDDEPSAAGRR